MEFRTIAATLAFGKRIVSKGLKSSSQFFRSPVFLDSLCDLMQTSPIQVLDVLHPDFDVELFYAHFFVGYTGI